MIRNCLTLVLLLIMWQASAQIYPIQATTQLVPPYAVYLPDYATGINNQLRVLLLNKDVTQPDYKVKLVMSIELNGSLIMRTSDNYAPGPVTLQPNQPFSVEGLELAPYMNSANIDFIGYSRQDYEQKKGLPEGSYKICFTAYDYYRPDRVQVSNAGCSFYYLTKNDPPFVNMPACGLFITPLQNDKENLIDRAGRWLSYTLDLPWDDTEKNLWYDQVEQGISATFGTKVNNQLAKDQLYMIGKDYALMRNKLWDVAYLEAWAKLVMEELTKDDYIYWSRTKIKTGATEYQIDNVPQPTDASLETEVDLSDYIQTGPSGNGNINFMWTPRHTSSPNSTLTTKYKIELYEVRPKADIGQLPAMANNAVLTGVPVFTDETDLTNYTYGPDKPQLVDGLQYAWRIRAFDAGGRDWFKNNGYSEVCYFTFGGVYNPVQNVPGMEEIKTFSAQAETERRGLGQWQQTDGYTGYRVRYRRKNGSGTWFEVDTDSLSAKLYDLEPSTAYQAQVQGKAGQYYGPFSPVKEFTTPAPVPPPGCGLPITFASGLSNEPLPLALPFMVVKCGKFEMMIDSVEQSGSPGWYSGSGRIFNIPFLAIVQAAGMLAGNPNSGNGTGLKVTFNNIFINRDREVTQGLIYAVTRPLDEWVAEFGGYYAGGSNVGSPLTGDIVPDVVVDFNIKQPWPNNIRFDSAAHKIIITPEQGAAVEINTAGLSMPVVIEDKGGNLYSVTANGTVTSLGKREPAFALNNPPAALNQWDRAKGKVVFSKATGSVYAFDEWQPVFEGKDIVDKEYERFSGSDDYRVPSKVVPPSLTDLVTATFTPGSSYTNADSLKFFTAKGIAVPVVAKTGNQYTLRIAGGPGGDAQEVFAVYKKPDGKYGSIGKLLVVSYAPDKYKVVLVPLQGATVNAPAIQQGLQKVYGAIGIDFTVETDNSFSGNTAWDTNGNGKLDVSGSGPFSNNYTGEEAKVIKLYGAGKNFDRRTIVLFVSNMAPPGDGDLLGKMPREKRFGFLFTQNATAADVAKTVAHEIGHGAFKLEHTFGSSINLPKGGTDNLMDYGTGMALYKFQWDIAHDPGVVWGIFESDKNAENTQLYFVEKLLDHIKANKGKTDVNYKATDYIVVNTLNDWNQKIYLPVKVNDDSYIKVYVDFKVQDGLMDLTLTDNVFKQIGTSVDFSDKYHTGFYIKFKSKPGNQLLFEVWTQTYEEFEKLMAFMGLLVRDRQYYIDQYNAIIAAAGNDCDKLDVVMETAPSFVLQGKTDEEKWNYFTVLNACPKDAGGTNEFKAIANILQGLTPQFFKEKLLANRLVFRKLLAETPNAEMGDMLLALGKLGNSVWTDTEIQAAAYPYPVYGKDLNGDGTAITGGGIFGASATEVTSFRFARAAYHYDKPYNPPISSDEGLEPKTYAFFAPVTLDIEGLNEIKLPAFAAYEVMDRATDVDIRERWKLATSMFMPTVLTRFTNLTRIFRSVQSAVGILAERSAFWEGIIAKCFPGKNWNLTTFETSGQNYATVLSQSPNQNLISEMRAMYKSTADADRFLPDVINSGSTVPQKITAAKDVLFYKIVPKGSSLSTFSPYYLSEAEYIWIKTNPLQLEQKLGLPLGSVAVEYDVFTIKSLVAENKLFQSTIAPTKQFANETPNIIYKTSGGKTQTLIINNSDITKWLKSTSPVETITPNNLPQIQ